MVVRRSVPALAGVLLSVLGGTGCAIAGPKTLRGSRSAYNDAIVATNNQQVLGMIVRMRYGEPTGLLAVSSITANMRIQSSAGAELGVGADGNYRGNLVPLSVGFAYEESPTISYAPVQGQKYLRELLSPLPLDLAVLILRALRESPQAMTFLVRSINGIPNPDFLAEPSVTVDPRFTRLVELLSELARLGHVAWAQDGTPSPSFVLVVTDAGRTSRDRIDRLYELLGFAAPEDADHVLPVRLGIGRPDQPAIHLETRSLYELLRIAAASVEVPEEHVESGIVEPMPPAGAANRDFRIRRSEDRPERTIAAVRHRGSWYSIDAADAASKLMFRIVDSLISVRVADAVDHPRAAPVLTVPVSR